MKPNHIRIALIFEFGTLNGGERSMLAVLDELARSSSSYEFVALAPEHGPLAHALRQRGIRHIPLVLRDAAGVRLPRERVCEELRDAVRMAAADLIHANSLSMGRLTGAIADELQIPTTAHLRDILKLSGAAVADLNRNRMLLAVSEATKEFHISQGLDADLVRAVYNGVDCDLFRPRESSGWLRRELKLPAESFLVLTVGQIGLRKGQDVLAEAAALVGRRLSNVDYLLVGERHSSKPESVEFEQAIVDRFQTAGLGSRLHRLGNRDDVAQLMNEVDLLVHPAHQEPLGRVLLEAGAAGLPIVATAVGGTEEILEDGVSARLVPPGDSAAMADTIVELSSNEQTRSRLAAAARDRIETRFNIGLAARKLAAVWTEIAR